MEKILVVEDTPEVQTIIKSALSRHDVTVVNTLELARLEISNHSFSLILLDIGLPDGDGLKFLNYLRSVERTQFIPVFFISGRKEADDIILGLNLGAEDYITKPFNPFELRARVENMLRRERDRNRAEKVFYVGDIHIDVSKQKVFRKDEQGSYEIDLTPLEFKIFCFFARSVDHVHSREKLIQSVWGDGHNITDRAVDTHVSNIRKKIQSKSHSIQAVYGQGYSFRKAA